MARRSWKAYLIENEGKVQPVKVNSIQHQTTELEAFS